jgi:hypothetical protein
MKVKPKEVFLNVPVCLTFKTEDEAAKFAADINSLINGKVKLKYDILGTLTNNIVSIFYFQRNDEFFHLRESFIDLINQEECGLLGKHD